MIHGQRGLNTNVFMAVALALFLFFVTSPELSADNLEEIVHSEIVTFGNSIPKEITAQLGGNSVLVIGEYHDISGHQEVLGAVLPGLFEEGYRTLLLEFPQSMSWILENYVQAQVPFELPSGVKRTYGVLLEESRQFNLSRNGRGYSVKSFDINHRKEDFVNSLAGLSRQLSPSELLDDFVTRAREERNYRNHFNDLEGKLERDSLFYRRAWGDDYWERVEFLIKAEALSIEVRKTPDFLGFKARKREEALKKIVDLYLQDSARAIINTGFYHAQQRRLFGTKQKWLAEHLGQKDHPFTKGNMYSLVVVPARGEMKFKNDLKTFSLTKTSPPGELFALMLQESNGENVFLSLDNEYFRENKIRVNYHYHIYHYKVRGHFDGFLILPEVKYIG